MGPAAIPKLEEAIWNSQHPDIRRYAVYCVAAIGGSSAYEALGKAIQHELDPCVKRFMRASLNTINVQDGGLKSDTVPWWTAFQCRSTDKL